MSELVTSLLGHRWLMRLLTLRLIAQWSQRDLEAVRSWVRRGTLKPVACDVKTHAQLFDMSDVPTERFNDTLDGA